MISSPICLDNKSSPRFGLRKRDFQFASLHSISKITPHYTNENVDRPSKNHGQDIMTVRSDDKDNAETVLSDDKSESVYTSGKAQPKPARSSKRGLRHRKKGDDPVTITSTTQNVAGDEAFDPFPFLSQRTIKNVYGSQQPMGRTSSQPLRTDQPRFRKSHQRTPNIHTQSQREQTWASGSDSPVTEYSDGCKDQKRLSLPPKRPVSPYSSSVQMKAQRLKMPPGIDIPQQSPSHSQQSANIKRKPTFRPPPLGLSVERPIKEASPKQPKARFRHHGAPSSSTGSSQNASDALAEINGSSPNSQIRDDILEAADILDIEERENVVNLVEALEGAQKSPISIDDALPEHVSSPSIVRNIDLSCGSTPSQLDTLQELAPQSSGVTVPSDSLNEAKCPFCKAIIDKAWFEEVAGPGRLSMRQQAEICNGHKIRSGWQAWEERGYPEIDWERLHDRLNKYHSRLEQLLDHNGTSFYRNVLEDVVRSGKNRTLRQTMMQGEAMEGLTPGYYGSKGAKIMYNNIIDALSSKLRRLGHKDKLITASGVSGYVQAVLAPELAVMLVMDDMKVGEDRARDILRESVDLGHLLNEEEEEFIHHELDVERVQPA